MKRKYVYENAIIYISNTDINYQRLHNATENFMKKVLKEKTNGNYNSSGDFREK
jgi:hypothetical protein